MPWGTLNGEISSYPLLLVGKFLMNCASCKTDCHHILHSLFVDDLTRILVVGGLGVEDQRNGRRKVPILPRLINFCGVGQKMKPRAFAELEQKFDICSCSYRFIKEKCCVCTSGCKNACHMLEPWNRDMYNSVWVSKCFEDCSNITFSARESLVTVLVYFQITVCVCVCFFYVCSNLARLIDFFS
jgi:hypothetical protein